jgi:NSS family neurotransmitter:Na+ symporter
VFILALTGTAVGLGNVWRFPYLVGEYGGSAFILLYLACVLVVGLPLMVAELVLGRRGRRGPVSSVRRIADQEGRSGAWTVIGWSSLAAGVLLLSAYSVVGGWSIAYIFRATSGAFSGLDSIGAARLFRALTDDPERVLAWHTVFIAVTVLVVGRGLRHGLEEAVRWFMPLLLLLLVVLVFYARDLEAFPAAAAFLLRPDFSHLSTEAFIAALGHAFFSLSIGFGALLAFGAYSEQRTPLVATAVIVVLADTAIALLAGLAIFPLVFQAGMGAGSGPGLIFQTLPLAFGSIPGGRYIGAVFFAMLAVAAWTSAFAMLEPAVAALTERGRMHRSVAASVMGVVVWALGLVSVLSFNVWSHIRLFDQWTGPGRGTLFDILTFVATSILLPATGLAMAVFVGWRVSANTLRLELGGGWGYRVWLILVRFVTPVAVVVVFLQATGLLRTLAGWKSL